MIHFWNLPQNRIHIRLNEEFKEHLIGELLKQIKTVKNVSKVTGYSINTIKRMKQRGRKIKIDLVIRISKILNKRKFDLFNIERNILWIGNPQSKEIWNPKLPFDFATRHGARFIAAIFNDGCLTIDGKNNAYGSLMYDNFDKELRESVKKDAVMSIGGNINNITYIEKEKKRYILFPAVFRDIVSQIIEKGPKSEKNQNIPDFIFDNNELILGWLEQTIADEGEVRYYPKKYRRCITWKRSVDITDVFPRKLKKEVSIRRLPSKIQKVVEKKKCKLIEDEIKMLKMLGISYDLYNLGAYPTSKGKIRTRWQISITKRENLLKLRKMIKIPHIEKDKKFSLMMKGFVRYKESLNIKKALIKAQKRNDFVTSRDLKKKMNYKNMGTASQWMRRLENEGFLKCVKESIYSENNREPARYVIQ